MDLLTVFAWIVMAVCAAISTTIVVQSWRNEIGLMGGRTVSAVLFSYRPSNRPTPQPRELAHCMDVLATTADTSPLLIWTLQHPEALVREAAARSLGRIVGVPQARASLQWLASNDSNVRVRRVAAEILETD